jgi:hypothetical protein
MEKWLVNTQRTGKLSRQTNKGKMDSNSFLKRINASYLSKLAAIVPSARVGPTDLQSFKFRWPVYNTKIMTPYCSRVSSETIQMLTLSVKALPRATPINRSAYMQQTHLSHRHTR